MKTLEATVKELPTMNLSAIASLVRRDWKKVSVPAKPYLDAMLCMDSVQDNFGADSGKSIVAYFLGNATGWRGEVARAVKAELNKRIK